MIPAKKKFFFERSVRLFQYILFSDVIMMWFAQKNINTHFHCSSILLLKLCILGLPQSSLHQRANVGNLIKDMYINYQRIKLIRLSNFWDIDYEILQPFFSHSLFVEIADIGPLEHITVIQSERTESSACVDNIFIWWGICQALLSKNMI